MNNNMPNNFNNGFPSNNDNLNVPVSPNDAKEQLMGGQSAVGNGPGVMQGVSNVPNDKGIMQGNAMPSKPESSAVPGQGHSGINAFTLQKEEVKPENPGVVSIPNFAPNIPEPPKPEVKPEPQPMPNLNQNVNNDKPMGVSPLNQPAPELAPKPVVSPQPEVKPEVKPEPQPMPNLNLGVNPMENKPEEVRPEINPAPNTLGQVNNQNLNSFPFNNMNQVNNQPVNNVPNNNVNSAPTGSVVMDQSVNNMPNKSNVVMGPNNGTVQMQKPATNSLESDVVEMPDVPDKKFPLSTREMILIGIALVGIIAVIIVYWPK